MADQEAQIKITVDTGDAKSQIAELVAQLDALSKSGESSQTGLAKVEESSKEAGEGLKEAKEGGEAAVEGFGKLSENSELAAKSLEMLGLEAGGAAGELVALSGLLKEVGEASPILFALGAAIAGLSIGFGQLGEAVEAAAKSQYDLTAVNGLLVSQGSTNSNAWKEQAKDVDEYTEKLAANSIFTRTEYIEGIRQLLAYGMSYNDALRSQAAAQGLAIGLGEDLATAEQQLASAYDGRLLALKRLGIVTQEEVKNGISYEVVLQRINQRLGTESTGAVDTYIGQQKNLANIFESLADTIGSGLLPVLQAGIEVEKELALSFEETAQGIAAYLGTNQDLIKGLKDFELLVGEIAHAVIPIVVLATEQFLTALAKLSEWVYDNQAGIKAFFEGVFAVGAVLAMGAAWTKVIQFTGALVDMVGAIPGVVASIAALEFEIGGLTVAEAVATGGMSLLVSGIVLGGIDLIQHWQDYESKWDSIWNNMGTAVDNVVAGIESNIASVESRMAQLLDNIGGLWGISDALHQDAAGRQQSAFDTQTKNGPVDWSKADGWGSDDEPGKKEKGSGEASEGLFSTWGVTTPSDHQIPGTETGNKKGSGGTFSTQDIDPYIEKINVLQVAQKGLDETIKNMDSTLNADRAAVANATTVHGELAAKYKLEQDSIRELHIEDSLLSQAIVYEESKQKPLADAHAKAIANYNAIAGAINKTNAEIQAHGEKTTEDDNKLAKLNDSLKKAKTAIDETATAINTNTANLDKNTNSLEANRKKLTEMVDPLAAVQREWNGFITKQEEDSKLSADTQGKSAQQLYQYYTKAYLEDFNNFQDAINKKDDATANDLLPKMEQDYKNMNDQLKAIYDQDVANAKAANQEKQKLVDTFVSDIIQKHQSLKDTLKSIYDQMVSNWSNMISQMIAKSASGSSGLGGFLNGLIGSSGSTAGAGGGIGGGGGAGDAGGLGAGLSGITGIFGSIAKLFGGGGGSSSSGYTGPDFSNASFSTGTGNSWGSDLNLSTNTIAQLTGSTSGVSPNSATALANTTSYSGPDFTNASFSGGSAWGGNDANGTISGGAGSSTISGAIGGAFSGYALGSSLSGLFGGNSTPGSQGDSAAGGAIGAVAGSLIPGVGTLVGSAVGSFIGGLFGPKASNEPDIYNTQAWGQGLANLQGSGVNGQPIMNANGQQFNSQVSSQLGGLGELAYIGTYLQQNPNGGGLSSNLVNLFQGLGTSGGDITGGKNGNLSLNNGQTVNWQTLVTDAANAIQQITSSFSNGVYIMNRMAPNFNQANVSQFGSFTNNTFTPNASNTTGIGNGTNQPVQVVVNVNNPTTIGHTVKELANVINQTISRNVTMNYNNTGLN